MPHIAVAQSVDNSKLDISEQPICFSLRNEADYRIFGNLATAQYMREDGIVARHRSNFRLDAAGSKDDKSGKYTDREDFCSYGPFLPDRMLILTLRTLFPVFECHTRIDTGQEIVIKGARRADDSGVITWAECFQADGTPSGKPAE
ncbi:MAG: hypothetical protein H6861_07820 [Rhodospirillales bacterium]|nr:hypothetical protein [Rhodospirillales bacterium]